MQVMPPEQAALIRGLLPSVVNIKAFVTSIPSLGMTVAASGSHNDPGPKTLRGSGFIIDAGGVILTNQHVVDGAYDLDVGFSDGSMFPGRVIAIAPCIDLALIKVNVDHPLVPIKWGDSDTSQIGDAVFAIGNPLGLGVSVTAGIVSALNRDLTDTPYDDYIQTDAAINHGNSGGPLFNRDGEVIGIDTAIISPTAGSVGLGFAIPANDAHYVSERLLRDGRIDVGYIGATFEPVSADIAVALGMPQPAGSIVTSVYDASPATAAGLRVGDVITRYDDKPVFDERALQRDIAKSSIQKPVPLTVLRNGQTSTLQVTPVEWSRPTNDSSTPPMPAASTVLVPANLGLSLNQLTPDLRARFGLAVHQSGVLVSGVTAGTDAYERGLEPGDVILRSQTTEIQSPPEVQATVDAARSTHRRFVLFLVARGNAHALAPEWIALKVSAS